jgi:hypothetical protein
MKTKDIRTQLEGIAKIVQGLEAELETARAERRQLVRAANNDPDISMSEAARLAGLSRVAAYEALRHP